ncbi:uncharacterized protein CBL_04707 [Carabus blaptoides fortunei]
MLTLLVFLSSVVFTYQSHVSPVVRIKSGLLRGEVIESPASESNKIYYSFQGIPYARPPIARLRFQAPREAESWTGIRDAYTYPTPCIQYERGSEDCLYLNVYTTALPDKTYSTPRSVLVYIHGGAFIFGSPRRNVTGPEFFMDEDIILVSIQYRLSVFGFLNTQDEHTIGNLGLKDQVAALKWVQKNIANFGGDPSKVTIFGQSAGGAAVQYLLLSPLAKGLFHGAISDSGSTLNRWAFQQHPRQMAFKLGSALGIYTNDSADLVNALLQVDARKLIDGAQILEEAYDNIGGGPFIPSIEHSVHPDTFLSASTYETMTTGDYLRTVPYLTGYNEHEGNYVHWYCTVRMDNLTRCLNDPELLVPKALNLKYGTNSAAQVTDEIVSRFYHNSSIDNAQYFEDYTSDEYFVRGIRKSIELMRQYSTVYAYKFMYLATNHTSPLATGHGAELRYLFYIDGLETSTKDKLTRKRMVRMWSNFVKYGNPTPVSDPLLTNIRWPNISSPHKTPFLVIDDDLSIVNNVDQDNYNFWETLFAKFGNPPYYIW